MRRGPVGGRSRVGPLALVAVLLAPIPVAPILVASGPASAQMSAQMSARTSTGTARTSGGWGAIVGGVPEAIVIVSDERTIVRWEASGRGGPAWVCGYHPIVAPVHSIHDLRPVVDWLHRVDPEEGGEYMLACFTEDEDGGRTMVRSLYVIYERGDVFSGIAETERALDEARRRLPVPDPDPVVNPPTEQLVGLPMWMWLERPWDRLTAVAEVGETWAAVAAWPVASLWTFADGTEVGCDRGVPYDVGRSPRDQWSDCTYTFQYSSAAAVDGVEWVRVTMVWRVEWYASDIGGQPLGIVERSTEFPVRVVEAQAVVH